MIELGSQRAQFDIPDGIAYFNTAYYAPLLNESRDRLVASVSTKSHPWTRTSQHFFEDAERLRMLACGLFGGDADGYAIIPAASYGLSAAARAIEPTLKPGSRIIVLDEEFPSNVLPWRGVAGRVGASITTIPTPADGDWTAATLAEIARGAGVVASSNCHWTNGTPLDLVAIGQACRSVDAAFVVDGTQALGAMPFNVEAIHADFVVAAGYKWMLGPYGVGLAYVAPRWRDSPPLEESWLARDNAADFTSLANYSDRYMPGARRFDVGEKCTSLLPGAIAALEQLQAWGVDEIARSLSAINSRIQVELETLGFTLSPAAQRCPHMFGARLPEGFAGDFVGSLRSQKVFVSQRASSIRFAPHLHITEADIEQLLSAIRSTIG
ncbi:MAG: aminotransferase class V-fold PLP-dependent enzyme [bacterium]